VKGRTDEGAKRPVTRRVRLLAARCGVSCHRYEGPITRDWRWTKVNHFYS